jgi:hypothetical protein
LPSFGRQVLTPCLDEHLKYFFDDNNSYISKLGQDQKFDLEGELTPQETLSALKLMKKGKSPGMDGTTI